MGDINASVQNLQKSITAIQGVMTLQTANGAAAAAALAAAKKALTQTQALLGTAQASGKAVVAKQAQIDAAEAAWTAANQAQKLNANALRDQIADAYPGGGVQGSDLDSKAVGPVQQVDAAIAAITADKDKALSDANQKQTDAQTALDAAAQKLDGALQAFNAKAAEVAAQQKAAGAAYADAQKQVQAGALPLAVVRYADFTTAQANVTAAQGEYGALQKAVAAAFTAWQGCLGDLADAQNAIITAQQACDNANTQAGVKQQSRDQDAQTAVQNALSSPSAKPKAASS